MCERARKRLFNKVEWSGRGEVRGGGEGEGSGHHDKTPHYGGRERNS